jgi:hypothetical protein
MISKQLLVQLEKKAKPGITIHYTDLNNTSDKDTVTDPKNELSVAIKAGKIGDIVIAIYKNTYFRGHIGVEPNGKIHITDQNNIIKQFKITTTGTTLRIYDPVNNKTTTIEHTKNLTAPKVEVKPLQDQLLETLKKKKMSDKDVIALLKNLLKNK